MQPKLERFQKRQLQKIYQKIEDGSNLCKPNCHNCCIEDIKLTYVEFAFLIDGMPEQQVREVFTKPRKEREDGKFYMCPFIDDSNKCSRYENRPWICRHYRRYPEFGKCGENLAFQGNMLKAQKILELNEGACDPMKEYYETGREPTITDFFKKLFP
jgi:Fe-S-cluster containining protein